MSTEIITIEGSCHSEEVKYRGLHKEAKLYLTRFYNGFDRGSCLQLTISANNKYGTSYIHLTKDQCSLLAKTLLEAFDYNKYPPD
ncbi:MAG: hypothetical protein MUE72_09730 [Chitinophagaceae bacterium]|jgi:hypothetical protein|nr:hypothetical protein [Chitinophagaceae bacterium]